MKYKKHMVSFFILCSVVSLSIGLVSCQKDENAENISHYTCPMAEHKHVKEDAPGQCPICTMTLVPVMVGGDSDDKTVIKINPRYVQNIGVLTETIQKRVLIQEIPTHGKVAHDHKLWVAQNEYIESLKLGDTSLIKASEMKLKFLGLSDQWIASLKKNRVADISLHLESKNKPTFFEAFVYQEDIGLIKEGMPVTIQDQKGRFLSDAKIRSIGTLVDMTSRSVRVLIESDTELSLKLNTFIQVNIKVPLGEKLSIPEQAILFNGTHTMTYVMKEKGVFEARVIRVGALAGKYYEVLSGLNAGESVVTNGHFLIDSESQIKGGTPKDLCPEGERWDTGMSMCMKEYSDD
jgi:membrane fusion protein, copper/silver efflux system